MTAYIEDTRSRWCERGTSERNELTMNEQDPMSAAKHAITLIIALLLAPLAAFAQAKPEVANVTKDVGRSATPAERDPLGQRPLAWGRAIAGPARSLFCQ